MQNKFYSERHYQRRSFAPYVYNVHAWGCSWILSAVCYVWHRTLPLSICKPDLSVHHWNGNVFILMKFSSLAALEVVKMTTSSAASDENFVKMTTFLFQCIWCPLPCPCYVAYRLIHLLLWAPFQYKDHLSRCRNSHYKDESVMRQFL